ncbi:arabinogalactan oligomer / maltooligosaccharide transport system permease protein, partial [Candidatus Hakubella thermalkaliphila]
MEALTTEVISRTLEQVGSMVLYILVGTLVLEVVVYLVLGKVFKSRYTLPYMLVAAAAVGLALLVVYPIGYEVRLAFTNMSLRHFREYTLSLAQGLENFKLIFAEPVLKAARFFPLLGGTILWTAINLIFHVSGGLGLALLLNRAMRGRGLYR